ncbi:uncharacterized protein V2V93DRAFT_375464 [Kockiozyma suomiensis]|uniref:uncharacterized protein n=1 Tax=Kockiozyma suomiensis TaxID=1337062 RepID=UPI0033433656
MAFYYKPITLVAIWFALSNIIVSWDASYILARPHSFPGGKLHFIWKPYALYGTIDYVYGWPAYNEKDGFPAAQSFLTLVEAIFMSVYIYTSYFTKSPSTRLTGAFIGLIAATSCFSKTVLYMLCEYFSGYKYVGHNPLPTLVMLYLIPSAPWIFMNFYSMLAIAGQLKSALMSIPSETDKKTK